MFASLGSFSIFFFTVLALIAAAIFFEDKLIALEERRIARNDKRKHTKYNNTHKKGL